MPHEKSIVKVYQYCNSKTVFNIFKIQTDVRQPAYAKNKHTIDYT